MSFNWPTLIPIVLGFIPGLVWLVFFLQEDYRCPEPKRLIFSTFLWGGLITLYVLPLQIIAKNLLQIINLSEAHPLTIFFLAGIEELLKFAVVYLWLSRRKDFDEPIDAMIYMISAALGFATVENVAVAIRAENSFEVLTLRFIGANLLHSLASGIVGYYWAKGIRQGLLRKYLPIGLFVATFIHAIFNFSMLQWGPGVRVLAFLVIMAFFVLNDFEDLKGKRVNFITA